jgi:hypothetical protein
MINTPLASSALPFCSSAVRSRPAVRHAMPMRVFTAHVIDPRISAAGGERASVGAEGARALLGRIQCEQPAVGAEIAR